MSNFLKPSAADKYTFISWSSAKQAATSSFTRSVVIGSWISSIPIYPHKTQQLLINTYIIHTLWVDATKTSQSEKGLRKPGGGSVPPGVCSILFVKTGSSICSTLLHPAPPCPSPRRNVHAPGECMETPLWVMPRPQERWRRVFRLLGRNSGFACSDFQPKKFLRVGTQSSPVVCFFISFQCAILQQVLQSKHLTYLDITRSVLSLSRVQHKNDFNVLECIRHT